MSDRDGYEHGVPCGIAGAYPSPDDAARFYGELFGWEAEEIGDGHLVCRLRGRDAAIIGTAQDAARRRPRSGSLRWTTPPTGSRM